jgi:glycosyltransferase involved in cell wall biosynthesis
MFSKSRCRLSDFQGARRPRHQVSLARLDFAPEHSSGYGRMTHVAIVMGGILPEQLAVWRACRDLGTRITIVGTERNVYRGRWPWHPRSPEGMDAVVLRPVSPALRRGQVWWMYRGLARTIEGLQPDIVHVVSEPWGGLVVQTLFATRSRSGNIPVCVHGADNIYWHGSRPERFARQRILRFVLPRISGFASWSTEGLEMTRRAGLPNMPTAVVPAVVPDPSTFHPVDRSRRAELRAKFGLPPEQVVAAFVGRLDEQKGIRELLASMRSLGSEAPFLAVWGAGPLVEVVRREFAEGLGGRLGGALGLEEVAEAFQACDLALVPSLTTPAWKEQFGRVIVEAMLTGSPVIGFDSGAVAEVIQDPRLLVREGDVPALAGAVRSLAQDDVLRSTLGAACRESALARYAPPVIAAELRRFWEEALLR